LLENSQVKRLRLRRADKIVKLNKKNNETSPGSFGKAKMRSVKCFKKTGEGVKQFLSATKKERKNVFNRTNKIQNIETEYLKHNFDQIVLSI